jgi:hypothetical protein
MKRIETTKEKFDLNFLFYNVLKTINSTNGLSEKQIEQTILLIEQSINFSAFKKVFQSQIIHNIKNENKKEALLEIISFIISESSFKIFTFAIYILKFKPLLVEYSKMIDFLSLHKNHKDLLTLETDSINKRKPYAFRVNGALVSLTFFELIEKRDNSFFSSYYSNSFITKLFDLFYDLELLGLEANIVFGIIFQESISQSITSTAGSSLEELVELHLSNLGIVSEKRHDSKNSDLEYDHFFELNNKKFGISTKRTLRERYKQFKKTVNSDVDVFIHITSGLDLNEAKAKTITSDEFGCYIFVFPEIYENSIYLKNNPKIFSTSDLTLDIIKELI